MNPISQAKPQPIPAGQQTYGLASLGLFTEYTRDGYESTFGIQPPDFNPAKPVKLWFDSDAVSGQNSKYKTVDARTGLYGPLVIPGDDAAAVNIPGGHRFASWQIVPTGATRGGGQVNAKYLSSKGQADTIAAALGGTASEYDGGAYFPIFFPDSETRRWYQVTVDGVDYNVGMLIAQQYANGIGAPGHWQKDPVNGYYWVSAYAPPPPVVSTPKVAMPMRDLYPGERMIGTLVGIYEVVAPGVTLPAETAAAGAGLTTDEHAALMECRDGVRKLQGQ